MYYNTFMKYFLWILLLLFIAFGGLFFYLFTTYPATPLQLSMQYLFEHFTNPRLPLTKETYGFLPYWRASDIPTIQLNLLSEVNYFGLTIDKDGHIIKQIGNETEPGFREWQTTNMKSFLTKARIMETKVSVTIISHDNEVIETILDNKAAQQTLVNEIINQIKTNKLDGINIDFEYLGEADPSYRKKFTTFSTFLSQQVKQKTPTTRITLSIMPLAARDDGLFDLKKLAPIYDKFIGMSYDYYGTSADIAAPGAPMKGFKEEEYFFDVTTTYEDYLKFMPKEKILMGVPYYGWDRAVVEGKTKKSETFPFDDPKNYAAVISYGRLQEEKNLTNCTWDELAASRWCWYTNKETGVDHQVWIEDEQSLGIKYDFVKEKDLTGVAIWVLGYDKDRLELWELMQKKFNSQ